MKFVWSIAIIIGGLIFSTPSVRANDLIDTAMLAVSENQRFSIEIGSGVAAWWDGPTKPVGGTVSFLLPNGHGVYYSATFGGFNGQSATVQHDGMGFFSPGIAAISKPSLFGISVMGGPAIGSTLDGLFIGVMAKLEGTFNFSQSASIGLSVTGLLPQCVIAGMDFRFAL